MRALLALCVLCLCLPLLCPAQKQANIWLFGDTVGVNFNTSPISFISGATGTHSGGRVTWSTSCISDSSGKLLFYADGENVYNKRHRPMDSSLYMTLSSVSTQSSVIVPKPGSDTLFYLFTSDAMENYSGSLKPFGYNYSIVNMCIGIRGTTDTLGNIINGQKNIHLMDEGTEKLCAASDNTGGYWILGHQMFSDSFVAWHLTTAGIASGVATAIGPVLGVRFGNFARGGSGQMKFNAASNRVATVNSYVSGASTLDVFKFNRLTGQLSNHCQVVLTSTSGNSAFGVEFSPDGSKLFVTYVDSSKNSTSASYVLRFKVSDTCSVLTSSRDTLYKRIRANCFLTGIQAGPDGNLYIGSDDNTLKKDELHRINNPNGTSSYDTAAFILPFSNAGGTNPPSFVAGLKYQNRQCNCFKAPPRQQGISTPSSINEVYIIPNPADKGITISTNTSKTLPNLRLVITDATGRLICERVNLPTYLDMSAERSGIYFYRISGDDGFEKVGRFTVAH